jgi:hypothetical protein
VGKPSLGRLVSVGSVLLLTGVVIAVATWPRTQSDALGDSRDESRVRADLGFAVSVLGLFLVLLAGIVYWMRRVESIDQDSKP